MSSMFAENDRDELQIDTLRDVVGGTTTEPPPPEEEGMMPPPPEGDGSAPPPPPMGDGSEPPPPPPMGDGSEPPPPFEAGEAPPPHPDGYVNGFIEPLYEGLEYDTEASTYSWTLEIDPENVDLENNTFVVSADQVGEWEGGIPPEATDNGDGTYTIQCWPIDSLADNGDGTVTLNGSLADMFGGGDGGETGEGGEGDGGDEGMHTTPPHPDGDVNGFIDPLYDGLTYNETGLSEWTLPIDTGDVDTASNTFVVSADDVGTPDPLPGCATDNGDGTYTINCWPIDSVTDNGDGTVTLMVDIGPLAT
ncbi:hypothetical protein ACFOGJ_27580 [Marinibaculum pumilum]|uniref:Uncharacterized protein n=1 Tax=Marinibaculum pumilum TaxID=1766165 RepID=A0ABV7L9A0_9PROT